MVLLLYDFRTEDSAQRYFQQRYIRFLFCVSFCQLDVLSARTTAALVSRDRTRESDYVAGGLASLHVDRTGHSTPARNGSGGIRDFCSGVFRLCGPQLDADLTEVESSLL